MSSLAVTGTLTIEESGVNYAIVSGVGTLTGKRYTHVTRVVAADAVNPSGAPNVKSLRDDFTLVSAANSANIAARLLSYYSGARKVSARIKLEGERCGDILSLTDPFFDPLTAFLHSASVNASSSLLGACELIEGYVPNHLGNNISNSVTLIGSGAWTSPFTGELRVMVIQGGTGGTAGKKGEDMPTPTISSYTSGGAFVKAQFLAAKNAKAGKGGAPGAPGSGGKIYIATITVTQGQQIAYSSGVGGAGEVFGSNTGGTAGGETTFGSVSSASGAVYPNGYPDPINGTLLGAPGDAGIAGGDGVGYVLDESGIPVLNNPQPIVVDGVSYYPGNRGATTLHDSRVANGTTAAYNIPPSFGGGAAYKASGSDGAQNGSGQITGPTSGPLNASASISTGANGATALSAQKPTQLGKGGAAGNGGGGSGAPGADLQNPNTDPNSYFNATCLAEVQGSTGHPAGTATLTVNAVSGYGLGGDGSDGTQGADGGIILFWGG